MRCKGCIGIWHIRRIFTAKTNMLHVRIKSGWWLLLLLPAMIASCGENETEAVPTGQDLNYFPLDSGYTWTYQVDSIFYDGFKLSSDTFHFQVRHTVFDTFTDHLDRVAHVVLRERDTGSGWMIERQFNIVKTDRAVEISERDVRVVKMVFPVRDYQRWDGNTHNTGQKVDFRYRNVDAPLDVLDSAYDKTVQVEELDYQNVIEDYYVFSHYARHAGLVEFYERQIKRKNSKGDFVEGAEVHYRLLSYSKP